MPLPIVTDKLDAIPEPLRAAYVEREGKFYLDAEIEDNAGLKSALEKERTGRRTAEARAKAADDEKAALKAEKDAAELEKSGAKEYRKKWVSEELEPVAKDRDTYKTKYIDRALAGEVKGMLADLDVIDVAAAYRLLGDDFELGEDEKPALKADPTADVRKHLQKVLTEKYPYLIKGTQASGGGAGGSRTAAAAAGDNVFKWTEAQRAEFIQANGFDAYNAKLNASVLAQATTKAAA